MTSLCETCKHAKWDTTKAGRRHPNGYGRCMFPYKPAPLPAAYYWIGGYNGQPNGGLIDRRRRVELCPTYEAQVVTDAGREAER